MRRGAATSPLRWYATRSERGLVVRGWPRVLALGLAAGLAVVLALLVAALQLAHVGGARPGHESTPWPLLGLVAWIVAIGYGARIRTVWPTAAGRAASARWLGVRDQLRHHEGFDDQPPAAVAVWGRLLAYGIALGVARAAAVALPIGPADPAWAWSRETGTWRHLHVRYPKQAGAGQPPRGVLLSGLARVLFWAVIGFVVLPVVIEIVWRVAQDVRTDRGLVVLGFFVVFVAVPTAMGVYITLRLVDGVQRVWRGGYDLAHTTTTSGRVVKVQDGCVAVDDGRASEIVALPLGARPPPHLDDRVEVTFTPKLHHVQTLTVGGAA